MNAVSLYVEHGRHTFHSVHVEFARRVALEAHRAGAQRVVHVSGIGADPRSSSLYIRRRGEGEVAVRAAFTDAILIRPAVMFGPDDAFLTVILRLLKRLPVAFQAKLATLEDVNGQPLSPAPSPPRVSPSGRPRRQPVGPAGTAAADGIDKSQLTHPEPRRFRDKEHVKFVAKQACLVCGRRPADAHHLRFAQHRALGRKVSDEFTVPLCRGHHREAHRSGDEAAWWKKVDVDPTTTLALLRVPLSTYTPGRRIWKTTPGKVGNRIGRRQGRYRIVHPGGGARRRACRHCPRGRCRRRA